MSQAAPHTSARGVVEQQEVRGARADELRDLGEGADDVELAALAQHEAVAVVVVDPDAHAMGAQGRAHALGRTGRLLHDGDPGERPVGGLLDDRAQEVDP